MAAKVTFDTIQKLIICKSGITELDVEIDLYSDAKENWQTDPLLNKFRFPIRTIGGDDTLEGEVAPLYAFLLYGWRIRPDEANHILNIINGAVVVEGSPGSDPFADTAGAYNVRVRMYVPVKATQINSDILSAQTLGFADGTVGAALHNIAFLKNIEGGKWEIKSNQMIFYASDNLTEIARFNLFDVSGNPTMTNVMARERV